MRVSTVLLALPALAVAEQAQAPLLDQVKGWFSKATAAVSSNLGAVSSAAASAASDVPNPVDAAAKTVADLAVTDLTKENYLDVLQPGAATAGAGIEEWMIYTTGGNRTCFGVCGRADAEWAKAVALLGASSHPPHLAQLDCEAESQLCNAWAAGAPSIVYMLLPQPLPDQTTPATSVYHIGLNRTTVTAKDIAALHTEQTYKERTPYEGFFHPFDGLLAKSGVAIPFGYAVYAFSAIPSWAMMIFISFFSRTIMSRRVQPGGAGARPAAAPAS